jgi:hypothetical protein
MPQPMLIDFSEAGLDLQRAELEEYLLNLGDELRSGELVQGARLARESDLPDGSKSGMAAFVVGVLTAEVNRENIRKVLDFLGNQFYGKTLTLAGEIDGMTYSIEYRNQKDIDQAIETIERLSNLRVKIQAAQTETDT